MNFKFVVVLALLLFVTTGCGYKPTSHYAKNEINGNVYVILKVDINNATNSVLAKDAVNEMVVNEFGASLTNEKANADTIVNVTLGSVSYTTLQSDNRGFSKLYRTTVSISLIYKDVKTNVQKHLSVSDSYDYAVDEDSTISEAKKLESVKIASTKALNKIFSKIAVQSFRKTK